MIFQIADLLISVPITGGKFVSRYVPYLSNSDEPADIVVNEQDFRLNLYSKELSEDYAIYTETYRQFVLGLLNYQGFCLHACALEYEGKAYLFSGPCGIGKSTHARLWKSLFGPKVHVINDDKPAIRLIDNQWYAYGTPWCGKDGIHLNTKAPIAGLCFLKQDASNYIIKCEAKDVLGLFISQTFHRYRDLEDLEKMTSMLEQFCKDIPLYVLHNNAEDEAALLSFKTMIIGSEKNEK